MTQFKIRNGWLWKLSHRSSLFRTLALGAACTFCILLYTSVFGWRGPFQFSDTPFFSSPYHRRGICTPEQYAHGRWVYNPPPPSLENVMTEEKDALDFAGFAGCASSREFYWHLGADNKEMWSRFPNATAWSWEPEEPCQVRPLEPQSLLRDLVEQGGWLLIGDSITEGHFFSLSCLLYPHVLATPNYTANPHFDRAWPQHLYLNPSSPLVRKLRFPRNFDLETTPLVTFRRVDVLMSGDELTTLHRTLKGDPTARLFGDEQYWTLSPEEYMNIFARPGSHYGTLVINTGGHWTTTLFSAFRNESKPGNGIDDVLEFFGHAMRMWAGDVQRRLDDARRRDTRAPCRQVVVRAYLPGHEDCHNFRAPWEEVQHFVWNWYNWGNIWQFNEIFQNILNSTAYPDIHYLAIDHPARLRPDAHVASDCLHIMTGAGVMEGWTHYIWHYITNEIMPRIR
ncbi:hypothetical protein FISHEDRAFT_68890 [Fistulina hepatica ATCC 64428]|uniref:Uncharacterized protein n=1 Tax=Fistulina hepatica ATCC 64428 TaxID=1128425 RepID=A0A0D7ANT4_9AGAR|nr:hypothetical protein FISHEDRAFT_68890 [Fistulina hepatica ATCC 64428]